MHQGIVLGLYMGWLWVLFLNGPLLHRLFAGWTFPAEKVFLIFLVCHTAALLVLANISGRGGTPLFRGSRTPLAAGVATAAGCLAASAAASSPPILPAPLIVLGVLAAGTGSAILLTGCGIAFSRLPIRHAAVAFSAAVIIGTALSNGLGLLPFRPALLIACALPALAGWRLKTLLASHVTASADRQKTPARLPVRLKLLMAVFYTAGGLMYRITGLYGQSAILDNFWITNVLYCAACLVAGLVIFKFPSIDLRLIYRPVVPLLAAGFMLFPLLPVTYSFLPFAFLQTGYALFDNYTWLLFVYMAARHDNGQALIAEGMFYTTLFILVGHYVFSDASPLVLLTDVQPSLVAYAAAIVILLSTLIFRDQAETFAGLGSGVPGPEPTAENAAPSFPAPSFPAPPAAAESRPSPADRLWAAARLTEREAEILTLLAKGRNNPFIAEYLNISSNTLKTHLRNLYRKCGVANRQELIDLIENSPS